MAYVAKDDIIVFVETETNFIQGTPHVYEILLYKDYIGAALNLNQPTSFNVAVYVEDAKVLQYSSPFLVGVSSELIIDKINNTGKISFEIDQHTSKHIGYGKLYVAVSVFYENYYPQAKTYIFPRLLAGEVFQNPALNDGSGSSSGTGSTGTGSSVSDGGTFTIERIDGLNPTYSGMASVDSGNPASVTSIILRNLDSNGIRLTSLENFLTNRISTDNINGIITIHDTDPTNMYSIYKIESWERVDLNPLDSGGDSENRDGIKINIAIEASSTGPGVTKTEWTIGQTITYSLDAHGISPTAELPNGILTYVDKNVNPTTTNGDKTSTGILMTYTPYHDSYVNVEVNGLSIAVGNGTLDEDAYFSNDAGVTPVNIGDIQAGDELYWNGIIAGYNLEAGDDINFAYEAISTDII